MVELVEYRVALTDGGGKTFASTSLLAKDDPDAQGAKDWVAFLEPRWEDAWLILNISDRGITLKPGEF
jgi:hypothetical protein